MLDFPQSLIKAKLVKRYKRFFADAILENGDTVVAHCPNTGSMKTCGEPGSTIYLLPNNDPKRKLAYTWELTKLSKGFVGINTARPNNLVKIAIEKDKIPELAGYDKVRSEVKYGNENSRIDLLLERSDEKCFVEVKNCTLRHEDQIVFPDAVTERGLKHIRELASEVKNGNRAVLFFLVNRPDGESFGVADHIHAEYGEALREAVESGVEVLAYRANHSTKSLKIGPRISVDI